MEINVKFESMEEFEKYMVRKFVTVKPEQAKDDDKIVVFQPPKKNLRESYDAVVAAIRAHKGRAFGLRYFMAKADVGSDRKAKLEKWIDKLKPEGVQATDPNLSKRFYNRAVRDNLPTRTKEELSEMLKSAHEIKRRKGITLSDAIKESRKYMLKAKPTVPSDYAESRVKKAALASSPAKFPNIYGVEKAKLRPLIDAMVQYNTQVDRSIGEAVLGIDSDSLWDTFLQNVLLHSSRISDALGVPDKFRVVNGVLVYGKE